MNADLDSTVLLLDTETTDVGDNAQVIELAVQFGFGDEHTPPPVKVWRFKPTVPIHPGAQAIHGISMDMLNHELPFAAYAQDIAELIDSALVLIGYNIKFDLQRLGADLARAKTPMPDLSGKAIVDTLRLWHYGEPRTLAAAHRKFVGGDFDDAHSAAADIAATGRVTLAMLEQFGLSGQAWHDIADTIEPERKLWLGHTNHLKWDGDRVVITFGKHKDVAITDVPNGYWKWVLGQDFPAHVKEVANAAFKMPGPRLMAWVAQKYPPPAVTP